MASTNTTAQFKFPIFNGKTFFSESEYKQIQVLFEPLFPADHQNGIPGASDAKAALFLSQLLAIDESEYQKIPEWREAYREGLSLLDEVTQSRFNKALKDLTLDEAHELVALLEQGEITGLPDTFNQRGFFRMILEHCIKGCFADPRWGGNVNGIMWRWLGWIQPAEDIQFTED